MKAMALFFLVAVVSSLGVPANAGLLITPESGTPNSEVRLALVIGNGSYENRIPFQNPRRDAYAVAAKLEQIGFKTTIALDLDAADFTATLSRFNESIQENDVALFYYAGLGFSEGGTNYLAASDAKTQSQSSLESSSISVDEIVDGLEARAKTCLVFIDAARDDPFATSAASKTTRGLIERPRHDGTVVMYSTSRGEVPSDGVGDHSPFALAFLKHIGDTDVELNSVLRSISLDVWKSTNEDQRPQWTSDMVKEFFFVKLRSAK